MNECASCLVEDVFHIENRGCVLVRGVPPDAGVRPKAGDHLLLKRPDSSQITATLRGMQIGGNTFGTPAGTPILVADVAKADIPTGTEVWLL
jgi:hypothetical protein